MTDAADDFVPTLQGAINHLLETARGPLTLREIRRRLPAAIGRGALQAVLIELSRQGRIQRHRGNRWSVATPERAPRRARGIVRLTMSGAWIRRDTEGAPVAFVRTEDLRLALDGDEVEWEGCGRADRTGGRPSLPRARVTAVLRRRRDALVGLLHRTAYHWYVIPDDARIPWNVLVRGSDAIPLRAGRRVLVRLDPWAPGQQTLAGTVIEDLGPAEARETRRRALYRRHGLVPQHDEEARRESRAWHRVPRREEHEGRVDLREELVFTIDPVDARDFDDAVSLRRLPNRHWRLDVHIADVSHYVPIGSAVDREARARATSVYLVGEAIPMLPPELTTDVCSLRPEEDRLCVCVRLELDPQGCVLHEEIFRSIIRSRARLTYDLVQQVIEGRTVDLPGELVAALRDMHSLATRLRARRLAAGALDLTTPEVRFERDDRGDVVAIRPRGCDEAYHLIEEFMLLANGAVARALSRAGVPAIYRVHGEPEEDHWAMMEADLAALGLRLEARDRSAINALLQRLRHTPLEYPAGLAILRNLKRAVYSSHRADHFGLAVTHYTHFTSPIRRYPDLIVHRQWTALVQRQPPPYTREELEALAEHCSRREREADEAEADSVAEHRVAFFADQLRKGHIGPFEAVITAVHGRQIWVELRESLQRGLLHVEPWGRRGRRPRRAAWSPGEVVPVELLRVDERRRWVDFRLAPQA